MKTRFFKLALTLICLVQVSIFDSFCCTAVIFSSKVTASGKPVMMKNRDTGELNNRFEYFKGPSYNFIGLVNSPEKEFSEVWAGSNSAGFCIMNTASYNIKDDDIPESEMDGEGILMFKALGVCGDISDFDAFLDTLSTPYHVEANFGVIDAKGGAAYYEINNFKHIKYVVDEYKVFTNFSESGRKEDYEGWERYLTASEIVSEFRKNSDGKYDVDHNLLINEISRSYRHSFLGIKDMKNTVNAVDQDFIPRKSTSASTVFEGVVPYTDPKYTVTWSVLGYPACSIAIPLVTGDSDRIPEYMKKGADNCNSALCSTALNIKNNNIFIYKLSNGNRYFNVRNAYDLIDIARKTEKSINEKFNRIYERWCEGKLNDVEFYEKYMKESEKYYSKYISNFASFIKND